MLAGAAQEQRSVTCDAELSFSRLQAYIFDIHPAMLRRPIFKHPANRFDGVIHHYLIMAETPSNGQVHMRDIAKRFEARSRK